MPDKSHSPQQPMADEQGLGVSTDGDFSAALNARLAGWLAAMGVRFVRATADEVTAEIEIGPHHYQGYGIVHGGVYSGLIETVASVGAALWARQANQSVVGLENQTSFLHAAREGKLTVTGRPLMRGRRTQVWAGAVTDAKGRTIADGKVRLLTLEPGSALAGQPVKMQSGKAK